MADKCPACNHTLGSISDYPLVYVAKVVKMSIQPNASFIIHDPTIYVSLNSEYGNPRVPKEVSEYFKENPTEKNFAFDGWVWETPNSVMISRNTEQKLSLGSRIRRYFGMPIRRTAPEFLEFCNYYRHQEGQASINTIERTLNPYFSHLESLVGKEVPSSEVLPKFGESRHDTYRIPGALYDLDASELDEWNVQMFKQKGLPIPNLETPQPTRKVAFAITESGGGTLSVVKFLAVVGGLAYEGRLSKKL